ncbi:MAG: hypothetical protein ABIO94_03140 [Opitutaceae bacterium]
MTFLAAPIWNQIARDEHLETAAAKVAFHLNDHQLAILNDLWMKEEAEVGTPLAVARCLPTCLPLLTESEAVNSFVGKHPELRNALPEMLDAQEAVWLMEVDRRLTPDEQTILAKVLLSPEAQERWLRAALQAAAT